MKYSVSICLIALLLLIVLLVYRRMSKDEVCLCNKCKKKVDKSDKFCKNCGIELQPEDKEIIIKRSSGKITAATYLLLGIIIISIVSGFYLYSQNGDILYDLSGSTGVYAEKYDNTLSNEDYWIVDCRALSEGTFRKSFVADEAKQLIIEARTTEGKMMLTLQSDSAVKKYDISDTRGETVVDLSEFGSDMIKMSISHPKSEHIYLCIKWK